MHVVFLNTNQSRGGAAIAATRYFDAYRSVGGHSTYATGRVDNPREGVVSLKHWFLFRKIVKYFFKWEERMTKKRKIPGEGYWSVGLLSRFRYRKIMKLRPDLLCLNWVNDDFLSVKEIGRFKVPLVWVFHDLWAVTGGCHYPGGCTGFQKGCGDCPKLKYPDLHDWSRHLWREKLEHWHQLDITVLCPSHWMAGMVRKSELFGDKRIEVCPYSIELETFRPVNDSGLRYKFGIGPDQKILLFGAVNSMHDVRKGGHLLVDALEKLRGRIPSDELVFMVFGAERSPTLEKVPFRVINLGFVNDLEELALYYSASRAFVLPSLEDNLPNTVLESMACGTPVVAFDIGGISDMIDHRSNGYLVERAETSLLADALEAMLTMPEKNYLAMQRAARRKMERYFSREVVGEKLKSIFESIIQERNE